MTNAAVALAVTNVNGQEVTVKYTDGEKKVLIEKDTPIVAFAAGDKADIKPGAQIIIFAAAKQPDGSLTADRIDVGRGVIAADVIGRAVEARCPLLALSGHAKLRCKCPLLMLWTAPPPARECHEYGCC